MARPLPGVALARLEALHQPVVAAFALARGRIRRANPSAQRFFSLLPTDVERSITT